MSEQDAGPTPHEPVGRGRPPRATRFQKGRSGNPKGRPRGRTNSMPYDSVLGQMVTIREDGRERRVTAAEAFLLQLTQKGLAGDSAAARTSLAAIEEARAQRGPGASVDVIRVVFRTMGIGCALDHLGMAIKKYPLDEARVRRELQPWIVEAALTKLGTRQLTIEEQREVWGATRTPHKVQWSAWWSVKG